MRQELQGSPEEPPAVASSDEDAASAVGWSFEGAGRPTEPALPSECDAECIQRKAAAQTEAAKLAAERKEVEDLVAVKKEHVIEDARNLKHLMTAITEEKDLLQGLPAPPPPAVKPHWPHEEDEEGGMAAQSKTSVLATSGHAQAAAAAAASRGISEQAGSTGVLCAGGAARARGARQGLGTDEQPH